MDEINLNHALTAVFGAPQELAEGITVYGGWPPSTPPPTLDTLDIVRGIDAAIRLLSLRRRDLCQGSQAIWDKLNHAENYLDRQIRDLLKP